MSKKQLIGTTAVVVASLGASAILAAAPAEAQGGGGGVQNSGACTSHGTWKLKAKPDNGRIQIEFEVDVNRVGQTWHVRITDNKHVVVSRDATTKAPSGSFTVSPRTRNRAGTDVIRAHATRGSVTCGGSVRL
ncbi:MAG TPA: hypothetical protein VE442_21740 [Jatrophihabitans sp.]|jgi:hypothetical protein|nr:hypothetical protein [Jatrophihabitans sp.]